MATAKRVEPRNPDVTLTLTWDEATYVAALTGDVSGGGPYRQLNDGIWEALREAGLEADAPTLDWSEAPALKSDD